MNTLTRTMLAAVALAVGTGSLAIGQVSLEPPAGGGAVPATAPATTLPANEAQSPDNGGATTLPSAQGVLQELLREKGNATQPGSTVNPAGSPLPGANGLLREEMMIQSRRGHLKKGGDAGQEKVAAELGIPAFSFIFDNQPGEPRYPAMGVIPSRELERMEDAAQFGAGAGAPVAFTIVAAATQYRGKNYLYIKPSGLPMPTRQPPLPLPATAPAATEASSTTAQTQSEIDAAAPQTPASVRLRETETISGRLARLVRDPKTGVELIAFDSDGKQMYDAPMGVVPCEFLAVMENLSDHGNKPIKFKVSGEVTSYHGKNFLYLKFAQSVHDLGQGLGG